MPNHIIQYIWQYSKWKQIRLIVLTFASFPLLYFSLEIPKIIVNNVLSDSSARHSFMGFDFGPLEMLLVLGFSLLGLVVSNGLFKVYINTLKGRVGETLIRRLRYQLMVQLLKFPLKRFEHMPAGEISTAIVQETDPLAGFAAESFALPVFQGGTLLTILLFMFMQDWMLGVASLVLVPIQIFIIPRIQRQINALRKQRIKRVRTLSSRLVETVNAVEEVHIQGTQRYTLAEFSYRFGELYKIRLAIFKKKFFMKFLNNLIGHMTPFLFYVLGGYLILEGRLTIGALVAAIAAHKDFLNPWKELLNYYQTFQDTVVKYENIIEQFSLRNSGFTPVDTSTELAVKAEQDEAASTLFKQPLTISDVAFYNESGETLMQNINLSVKPGEKVAIVVADSEESQSFARIISGLQQPSLGKLALDDTEISTLPEHIVRQNLGVITAHPYLFNAAISYNLSYGLNHVPPEPNSKQKTELSEAIQAGTSSDWFDETFDCVWTDLARLNANSWVDVLGWIHEQMDIVNASEQMTALALREVFNPQDYSEEIFGGFIEKLLSFRESLHQSLQSEEQLGRLVFFEMDHFNEYATLEENFLFGVFPKGAKDKHKLLIVEIQRQMVAKGIIQESRSTARVALKQLLDSYESSSVDRRMANHFDLFNQESINKLQQLGKTIELAKRNDKEIKEKSLRQLLTFFLKIIPADWPGLEFSPAYTTSIIAIRQEMHAFLSQHPVLSYYPFDRARYNPGVSVLHNMVFGRFDETCTHTSEAVHQHINELVAQHQMTANLIQLVIINSQAGVDGHRIPEAARHTLNLVRTLLKKPAILIMHEALPLLSQQRQLDILNNIKVSRPDMTLIWISSEQEHVEYFDQIYQLDKTLRPLTAVSQPKAYPERPVTLLVAYSAGSATDYQTRIVTMMAAGLAKDDQPYMGGQPLVVVNHVGGGGSFGWNHFIETAGNEGYELAVYNIPHMLAQAIVFPEKVKYTLDDIEPLANWGADPAVLIVSQNSPFHSVEQLVKFAKKNPGKLTVSGAALYVGHHIATLQLEEAAAIKARYVPGGSGGNALRMVIDQQVLCGFNNLSDTFRYRDKVRVLAVADVQRNTAFFPDVPTFLEQKINVDDVSINFRGVMAPKGLPEEQRDYLTARLQAMFADQKVLEKMHDSGAPLHIMEGAAVRELWQRQYDKLSKLLRKLHVTTS